MRKYGVWRRGGAQREAETLAGMKKIVFLLLAVTAAFLSGVGAHSLANHIDPTSRSDHRALASATAPGGTQPCMACNYYEV